VDAYLTGVAEKKISILSYKLPQRRGLS